MREVAAETTQVKGAPWGATLVLVVLAPAWTIFASGVGAEPQDTEPQEHAEGRTDASVEESSRVPGMTPDEIEALGVVARGDA